MYDYDRRVARGKDLEVSNVRFPPRTYHYIDVMKESGDPFDFGVRVSFTVKGTELAKLLAGRDPEAVSEQEMISAFVRSDALRTLTPDILAVVTVAVGKDPDATRLRDISLSWPATMKGRMRMKVTPKTRKAALHLQQLSVKVSVGRYEG